MNLYQNIVRIFRPSQTILLGRWNLKSASNCEKYIQNYYGEPGYPNSLKPLWVEDFKKKEKEKLNKD